MARTKKAKGAASTRKPNQTWIAITQLALKAQQLAATHRAALGGRLSAAFLTAFAADLASLADVVPQATASKQGAVQFTAAQNAALAVGHNIVMGVRTAVRSRTSNHDVLLAYGVGTEVPLLVRHIKTALQTIADRATSQPAEAASFGIISDDITTIHTALAAIAAADAAQEAARALAPTTTKARNATAKRLLADVKMIAGTGMLVFANDLTTRAHFEELK